jgi:hypothetical protein
MGPPWPAVCFRVFSNLNREFTLKDVALLALSRISNLLDAHWFHALLQKVRKAGEDFSLWLTLVSSS